ncbi:MAG: dCTP deaminase [Rhodospirillaceae bacterium]|nr:dCTP deaminase [Rhodospirillaceae bacterium]
MILTDREIKIAIAREIISIDPAPGEDSYSSTSVDLTLDKTISTFRSEVKGVNTSIDSSKIDNFDEALKTIADSRVIPNEEGYSLKPQEFILAWTAETVDLKIYSRIAARIEGKSSLARFGVGVHVTAPTIHSGFKGRIRLEVANHGSVPVVLRSGMKVCQLIFEQTLGTPDKGYQGQFQNQLAT